LPFTESASFGHTGVESFRPQPEEGYAFGFQSIVFCSGN